MKNPKPPALVTIAILTTITIVFWVFFNVYRVFTNVPTVSVPGEILEPLNPTLDSSTIDKIQSRLFFSDAEIGVTQIATPTPSGSPSSAPSPTPIPSATPTATASATPTISPTPTPTP